MFAPNGKRWGIALAASGLLMAAGAATRGDDEPSRLGRLFRLGGSSRSGGSTSIGKPTTNPAAAKAKAGHESAPPAAIPNAGPSGATYGPHSPDGPATPNGAANRIVPQARVTRAATESDPLVTRVSIGRSDDGKQFCMFIQIFADGTILDSEGVHHIGTPHLRPIAQLLQSGELAKLSGHCGGPAADFIEQVHVVAYDRYRGKLRATSFSHSGNPQGCDPAVRQLHEAIDAIQMKLSSPGQPRTADATPGAAAPIPSGPANAPAPPLTNPIGLSPDQK